MEISLTECLAGKATRIKNNEFLPTAAYVEPFIERMSKFTDNFRINAKLPDQVTLTKTGEINKDDITYNRITVEALLPDSLNINGDEHQHVIGMVYGLDIRKPIAKLYRGLDRCVCTNLSVMNPELMEVQELAPETPINFSFVNRVMEVVDTTAKRLEELTSMEFNTNYNNVNEQLGKWIRNTMHCSYDNGYQQKVKLATSVPIDAYKLLFENEESDYFVGFNNPTSYYQVYNAFTQINTDNRKKDAFNNFEKAKLVHDILFANF